MQKLIIFSGNFQEARQFARQNNLALHEWLYPDSPYKIMGLRGAWFVKVGTWWRHRNAYDLEQQIKVQDLREIKMVEIKTPL